MDKFVENELGLKYIYVSKDTGKTLLEIEIPANKLKEIKDKIDKGEIEAYSILELSEMELSKLEIPSQIEEGVWLTDAYIKENSIYYVATIENEIEASDLSPSNIAKMKELCIEAIKEEGLVMIHKVEAISPYAFLKGYN